MRMIIAYFGGKNGRFRFKHPNFYVREQKFWHPLSGKTTQAPCFLVGHGTKSTCIILRHIPSWFEAVSAIAILQSCAQRGPKWLFWGQKWPNMAGLPMSQSGLRGPKMIPNDQYNMFLTIWSHFGTIWTLFDHFTQNLIFCLESTKCFLAKVIWSKNSSFV